MDVYFNNTSDENDSTSFGIENDNSSESYYYFTFYTWPDLYVLIDEINRKYVLIIVILISLVGNTLICFVLSQKKYRNNTTAVYLLSLAASDMTITLYMIFAWLDMFGVRNLTTFTCRFYNTVYDIGLYSNTWIMCIVSIERAISVCAPHKVKLVCTINRARGITIFLWLFCIVTFSLYTQIIIGYPQPDGEMACAILPSNFHIVNIHNLANIFLQFLVPYVFVLGSTILIVVVLFTKKVKKSKSVEHQNLIVTKKLLMINTAYVIFVTPVMVVESLDQYRQQFDDYNFEEYMNNAFFLELLRTLRAINSGLNFFIYFFNGTRFKTDTLELLRIKPCRGD